MGNFITRKNSKAQIELAFLKKTNIILEKKNKLLLSKVIEYEKKLRHIDDILTSPTVIADSIVESSINCEWFDDGRERSYLVNVVNFIRKACYDLTCGSSSIYLE